MNNENYKDIFKILVIGTEGVGKKSMINKFAGKALHQDIAPKAGVNFFTKIIEVEGDQYKFQFWDIIDNEKFGSLQTMYYTGASAVFFIFDLSNPQTFEYSQTRYKNILDRAKADSCPVILIGNNLDLVKDQKIINREKYRQFVKKEGLFGYIEITSAENENNLLKLTVNIVQKALKKSYQVKFLVNQKELEEIKNYAQYSNQTQSDFIRTAIWEKIASIDALSNLKDGENKDNTYENQLRLAELKKIRELLKKLS
ncbi:MAG: GTP-binding protein [Promethearchaeota archaeon]